MEQLARSIKRVAMVPTVGFLVLCLFVAYWQVIRAPALRADPHNSRARARLKAIEPGELSDRVGKVLLGARRGTKGFQRTYPEGRCVSHLTGYNSRSGLQRALRDALLGVGAYEKPWAELLEGPRRGNDVTLTVDLEAQELATRLMRRRRGAVIALDARDGGILALVSAPGYDPELILGSKWDYELFREDPKAPELNRGLQGLYPPGSVLKILTLAAALDLDRVTPNTELSCPGEYTVEGARITCPRSHGTVDVSHALQVSCNIAFAKMAERVGAADFRRYVKRFHLLDAFKLPLPSKMGKMGDLTGPDGRVILAETAFGQGPTLVTPMAIARLTLTIANGGRAVQPYLVACVSGADGRVLATGQGRDLGAAISPETARTVAGMMVRVVEGGTGRSARIRGVSVAGKTGSAENPQGAPHSWFTAFAPADDPRVVVTAIVENGGTGSESAAPIVRQVMQQLLSALGAI